MKHALAPVSALLIGVSILLAGQGLQGTLLPIRASLEGFSTLLIGFVGAAYFLGFTLGCLKGGELVKRVGHIRVFAAMTALASSTPLLHGLILSPWVWILLRTLTGFCFAVLYVVIESWLNERSTTENRGVVFSTYVMITLTVLAAGQMMVLLYDPREMQLFAIAAVLVSVAAIPVVLSISPSPEQPQTVELDIPRLFKISHAGTIGCLMTGFSNGAFWSLAPVLTVTLSDDSSLAAWFMTSAVLGGALGQWPLGFLSDRIGRRKVLTGTALAAGSISLIIVLFVEDLSFTGINFLAAAWGAVAFPQYALSVAHANDYAEPSEYVMVSSGLLLMYGIGAVLGPFVASAVMTVGNATGLYLYIGAIHFILFMYVLIRSVHGTTAPLDQHIAFGDALTTAHTASQVYEEEIQYLAEDGQNSEGD